MKLFEKILFAISFIIAFIGITKNFQLITLPAIIIAACIYLFFGWYLLFPEKTTNSRLFPFIISYLIAQTLTVLLFGIKNWPMFEIFAIYNFVFQLIVLIIILNQKKKLEVNYPFKNYLFRLIVCIFFSMTPGYMHIFN